MPNKLGVSSEKSEISQFVGLIYFNLHKSFIEYTFSIEQNDYVFPHVITI